MNAAVHDVAAVGAGPFNLGLAALADPVPDLDQVVFDREPGLTWHRGLMLDGALLQVSFLADLVTLVDPTSRHSFLAYLHDQDRMYPFYVRESFHPTRQEYEDYLRWAARRLPQLRFGHSVESVVWDESAGLFELAVTAGATTRTHRARYLVLGVGTEPRLPGPLQELPSERLLHSADFLHRTPDLDEADRVTVVGSGQSGAECLLELLRRRRSGQRVSWLTRSEAFAPLDYSKLVLEMTTPAYVDHFHSLPEDRRDALVRAQWRHYKGVSTETLDQIHDALYARHFDEKAGEVELRQGVAVTGATVGEEVTLRLRHADTGAELAHRTDLVVAATGYAERPLPLSPAMRELLHADRRGRLRLHRDHAVSAEGALDRRIFVANADLHTHGPAAPDLGIGAVRNAGILNAALGREVYRLPRRSAFTTFSAAESAPGPAPAVANAP
jgi:lysine N6-hydroxylase